jgi:CO dehydrogenase/acetyl-CoA synthase epsilon subunit
MGYRQNRTALFSGIITLCGSGTLAGSKEILMVKFLMMSEDFATNTALSTDSLYKSENFVLNNQQHLKGGK